MGVYLDKSAIPGLSLLLHRSEVATPDMVISPGHP